jgi:hypothetical protein
MSIAIVATSESTKPPRRFRRLRIAVSVLFGVLAIAMCVLWVRSCLWHECFYRGDMAAVTSIGADAGRVYFMRASFPPGIGWRHGWRYHATAACEVSPKFRWDFQGVDGVAVFPLWAPFLSCVGVAAVPWAPPRFGLQAMLIATSLVAVVLGLVCYVVRWGM